MLQGTQETQQPALGAKPVLCKMCMLQGRGVGARHHCCPDTLRRHNNGLFVNINYSVNNSAKLSRLQMWNSFSWFPRSLTNNSRQLPFSSSPPSWSYSLLGRSINGCLRKVKCGNRIAHWLCILTFFLLFVILEKIIFSKQLGYFLLILNPVGVDDKLMI